MASKDYYKTLGVSKDATEKEVRQAYRKLARKYHPDVNPDDKAAEDRFKEIAEAYTVLGDKKKRAEYDRRGPEGFSLGFDPWEVFQRARSGRFDEYEPTAFGFGDLGSILGDLFGAGRGFSPGTAAARGGDVEADLTIDFEDAVRGVTLPLSVEGRSRGTRTESITVRIPPGVGEGSRVRIAGKGGAGGRGGPPGDLYVRIHVRPHPFFRREGDHLVCQVPLSLAEAALGSRVEVPTLDGVATMTVPAGTRSGQRFRIRGKGAPRPGKSGRGDLYVDVQIVPPKEIDEESRRLLEQFTRRNPQPDLRRHLGTK